MKLLKRLGALAASLAAAALFASPALAQSGWSLTNDYVPSGGPIAAPAAGGTLNTGGWVDKRGGRWSVNSSNQLIEVTGNSGATASELVSPAASSIQSRIVTKFVAITPSTSNIYAFAGILRYSASGSNISGYAAAVNELASSGAAVTTLSITKYVNAATQTQITTSANFPALVAGTSYCAVQDVTQTAASYSTINITLYQSDCSTVVVPTVSATDNTASLQNVAGQVALWNYTSQGTIPITEVASYTNPTVPLQVGSLTATPSKTAITLSLSSPPAQGSGSGYTVALYRGTDPNFAESASTLLAANATFPYVDTNVSVGVPYYYGALVTDGGGTTANAYPHDFLSSTATPTTSIPFYADATLNTHLDVNLVFIGDSITNGYGGTGAGTASSPIITSTVSALKKLYGVRNVYAYNGGVGGLASADWLPGGTGACTSGGASPGCYHTTADASYASSGASVLAAANPSAQMVFTIMLGANDASRLTLSAAAYAANLKTTISKLLSDWPTSKVFVHMPAYFTPNIYNGASVLSTAYSYRAAISSLVASYTASNPGQVLVGDTLSYAFFEANYAAEMLPQVSYGATAGVGTGYLHPNSAGQADLGALWANAIGRALYVPASTTTGSAPAFRPGFH